MKLRTPRIEIRLDETATESAKIVPQEVQIMRTGEFYPADGKSIKVTPEMLNSMVQNFNENVRGVDIAVDYKHESDDIAAGWIKKLYLKNNDSELWAEVNWTPKGRQILSDKEFRYLSADFNLNYTHNETNKKYGPTLFGAGLTNRPFIKEMEPVVTLSETKGNQMDEKDKKIQELEAQIAALKKAAEGGDKPSAPPVAPANQELDDMKKQNADLQAKCAAYEASAAKSAEEKKLSEKKASFDKLMLAGKAVEAQRQAFMENDAVKFAENAMPINLSGTGSSAAPVEPQDKAQGVAKIVQLAEKKLADKVAITLGDAIYKTLTENPELRKFYES